MSGEFGMMLCKIKVTKFSSYFYFVLIFWLEKKFFIALVNLLLEAGVSRTKTAKT